MNQALQSVIDQAWEESAAISPETKGEVRQAISVMKKRGSKHERSIRDFRLDGGIKVGPPLREFRGILTGVPVIEEKENSVK